MPFPSVGDLPESGIASVSPALAGRFVTVEWVTQFIFFFFFYK